MCFRSMSNKFNLLSVISEARVHSQISPRGINREKVVILTDFTFRGPCVMIYSYNGGQRDAQFLKFI